MLADFHFRTEVRVRLPETDAMGVVFHGYFFTYMEVGRSDYLRNLGLSDAGSSLAPGQLQRPIRDFDNLVVRTSCDFRSPARFDDLLVVAVRVAELGRSSFRFAFRIVHKQDNRLIAEGESVHVAVGGLDWRPIPLPEHFARQVCHFERRDLRAPGSSAAQADSTPQELTPEIPKPTPP
jgi:acyl-CoA thioester hydrolase